MTHGRYAVEREEATPETAIGDRASRQRNRGLNLCENFLEHIKHSRSPNSRQPARSMRVPTRLWACQQYACRVERKGYAVGDSLARAVCKR